jgi:DNA repair protein SbcC/Rad50
MILLELEIEDYKQFRGKHLFAPTPNGVIAIIGQNGAGKTTLFEAIEWCLYQPREIRNDEIPPRGAEDLRPRVRIRFTNPNTGATHEIERTLKKTGAFAEIRQIDDDGNTVIATGSTTVSNYAATKLIGLEHKAFVATFFTRQKELSFFGALKPTERRREVGRLLGLETIRNAQELIANDRVTKRSLAQGLLAQYNQESGERDFDQERAGHQERLAEIDQQITETATLLIKAEDVFKTANAARAQLVEQREATLRLQKELATHQAAILAANTAITGATHELARLGKLEAERPGLTAKVEQEGSHERRVVALEADRERFQSRQSLLAQQSQALTDISALAARALATIAQVRTRRTGLAESDTLQEIDGFLAESAAVSSETSQLHLERLQRLSDDQATVAKHEADLERYEKGLRGLEEKHAALLALGVPDEQEQEAGDERDEAIRTRASHLASIESNNKALADYLSFIERDHVHVDGAICPTCGREIKPEDAAHFRKHASNRILEIKADNARLETEVNHQDKRIVAVNHRLDELKVRVRDLTSHSARIAAGKSTVRETESLLCAARQVVADRLAELDRSAPITEAEISEQRERVSHERSIEKHRTALNQIRESLAAHQTRANELSVQITGLGEVIFDPAELQQARGELDDARSARTRLAAIDQQLTRRPEHASAIETATAQLAVAQSEAVRLEAEIAANPIDDFALDKAELEVEQARQREQQERTQREQFQRARISIEQDLKQVEVDQTRLKAIATRAEEARVEADDLDRMYKEFNVFEQYVARRVRPQLEDMTSELVRVITENKYESVELDDDYGVKVWDGELGPYPIEHFSGGERDVIALSARLALSRLIGSQAANPPSFLVLDEVFGSLDRDRRGNVLDLLSSLAGSAESFQQLFVISHVDDVRLSPAFNEIWRVAELEDGSSRLENLNLSQGEEDL